MTAALILFGVSAAVAQSTVTGKIVDESGAPLIGATIIVPGTSQGAGTDMSGNFSLKVTEPAKAIEISYIGYVTQTKEIKGGKTSLGVITMVPDAVTMDDVVITSSIAVARKTPVAVSTISAADIEYKLGGQEFPEVLKSTPGIYSTKSGGGYGDASTKLRGFKSENVAVMVNGVPMNDMEGGNVYWSNWAGLADVTRSMQVQRGLGAAKVAAPSVGGSINIVTNTIDAKKGGTASFGVGNDGLYNISFSISTGLTKNGWAMSVMGAKRWADGYVQGTDYEAYNWFIHVAKRINDRHQLSLTAFGSPQDHYQRPNNLSGLSIEGYQQVANYMKGKSPYRYNPTFGYGKNGERKTSSYNSYHKPQISLNHQWQIDHKSALSTALYMSIGRGYGYRGEGISWGGHSYYNDWYGANNGVLATTYRNADGTFAYDQIQEMNEQSDHGSNMVMAKNKNDHEWYGLLSTYTNQIGKHLELTAGVDFRYYVGHHTAEICDLYNGKYYTDTRYRGQVLPENNKAAANPDYKYEKLGVGDVIYRDYDGHVHQEGIFGQLEYSKEKITAFVSGSLSNTGYWRYDRFYYDAEHAESEHKNYLGGTAKAGINYNVTAKSNIFANVGYISRAPFFSYGVFLNSQNSHAINPDATNEKVFSAEVGYGFHSRYFSANVNAYYTNWMDKTMSRTGTFSEQSARAGERYYLNLSGVDARHMGIEFDFTSTLNRWLEINGMLSYGDWEWSSNAKGYFYDMAGQPLADVKEGNIASGIQAEDHAWVMLQQKGIKVGGSAQTTASLGLTLRPLAGLRVGVDWTVFARNFSDYTVNASSLTANSPYNVVDPWVMPWGNQFDLSASYGFKIGNVRATIYTNLNNMFDQTYITDAYTPANGPSNWQSAYGVFYAFGRTFNVRLKINF